MMNDDVAAQDAEEPAAEKIEDPVPEPANRINEILAKITQWGKDRNIIGGAESKDQYPKLIEEFSEYADGTKEFHATKSKDGIKDGIGDTVVVLTMIAGIEGHPLQDMGCTDYFELPTTVILNAIIALGNIGSGIARNDKPKLITALDRMMQILADIASNEQVDFLECIQIAYNEIKDRKGILYKGAFIKSTDLKYPDICKELGKPT